MIAKFQTLAKQLASLLSYYAYFSLSGARVTVQALDTLPCGCAQQLCDAFIVNKTTTYIAP